MREELVKELKNLIGEILSDEDISEKINDQTDLINELEFDSIMIIQLIADIEDKFKIVIGDDDMDIDLLGKFNSLVNTIEKYLNKL